MANQYHIKVIEEGASRWNAWRRANPNEIPDLEEFDFTSMGALEDPYDAYLHGIDLRRANLKGTNLSGALLTSAQFDYAYLAGANLSGSMLNDARMTFSVLKCANLSNANLQGCNLSGVDLTRAILDSSLLHHVVIHGSCLDGANLINLDLSKTRGLHKTKFDEFPVVDERTLKRTRAGLECFPFLRLEIDEFLINRMNKTATLGCSMSETHTQSRTISSYQGDPM